MFLKVVRLGTVPNFGRLVIDDLLTCDTLEDEDRFLEAGGIKVPGQTAIPRGTYRVDVTWSPKFGKLLPEVLEVPGFKGIRIHGGVDEEDTEGCILVGLKSGNQLSHGIDTSNKVRKILQAALGRGEEITLEVL